VQQKVVLQIPYFLFSRAVILITGRVNC